MHCRETCGHSASTVPHVCINTWSCIVHLLTCRAFARATFNYLGNVEPFPQGKNQPILPGKRAPTKSSYRKQEPTTTDVTHFLTLSSTALFLLLVCYFQLLLSSPLLTRRLLLPWKGPESQKLLNLAPTAPFVSFASLLPSSPRALLLAPQSCSSLLLSICARVGTADFHSRLLTRD